MAAEFLYHNFGLKLYMDCYMNVVNKLNLRNDSREMRCIIWHIRCQIQRTAWIFVDYPYLCLTGTGHRQHCATVNKTKFCQP